MVVREVQFGSSDYSKMVDLRNQLLRLPLGLDLRNEDLSAEAQHWHFGLFTDDQLVGCVVIVPQTDRRDVVQLRQMAITPQWQQRGCGRHLLETVEARLPGRGVHIIVLHARVSAVGFYSQLGYQAEGEEFIEVGIPHVAMRKQIGR